MKKILARIVGRLRHKGRKFKQPGTSRILTWEEVRVGAVCTESLLWIFPQWQRAGPEALRSAHTARSPLTAAGLTLMHRQCSAHRFLAAAPPPPQPASLFAQPEHMLASHYAAHPNFVSLQLFNGHTSVFVCFLAIRLLHLYGWSGGWNNPWHLFREGGVHKEPEVQIHSLFFPFFFYFVKYEAMRPPISSAEIRAVAVF